jgi:uncharacterized membrane protein YphA (DoxX/SURF4 family)
MFDKIDTFGKTALGPLTLRLVLATVFIYHGLEKITPDTGYGSTWIIPNPDAWDFAIQVAVSWGEVLLGGLALGLGLFTRLAAAGGVVVQLGAIYVAMNLKEFSSGKASGWDLNLCLIGMCLALVFLGGGTISVDRLLKRRQMAKKARDATAKETAPVAVS